MPLYKPFPNHEVVTANDIPFVRYGRQSSQFWLRDTRPDKIPAYIDEQRITDIFQYHMYEVCLALERDGEETSQILVHCPDGWFYDDLLPLVAWKIDVEGADMMITGNVWLK